MRLLTNRSLGPRCGIYSVCLPFIFCCACDFCLGSLCIDDEPSPREEMLPDGGCYDEDGCDNGYWFCGIEIRCDADMELLEGCTTVGGSVNIIGDEVSSLDGLKNIVEIRGGLVIWGSQLTNLGGLDSLQRLGGIDLRNNAVLSDLSGISQVRAYLSVWKIYLEGNPALVDLDDIRDVGKIDSLWVINNDGLKYLLSEGDFEYVFSLVLEGNDELVDFSGLGNLTELRDLAIMSNDSIQDMKGLEALETVWKDVTISDNAAIVTLEGLSGLQMVGLDVATDAMAINGNPLLLNLDSLLNMDSLQAKLVVDGNLSLPSCEVKELVDYLESNTEWTAEGNVEEEDNLTDECSDLI